MAKKIERKAHAPVATAKGATTVDDLAILHPDREVTIAGRCLVIREYGFVEGLKMRAIAQPFIDALYALTGGSGGRPPSFRDIESMLVEHWQQVLPLVARAADVDVDWIEGLKDEDGYHLMQEWWLANSGFFIRRVVERLATERAVALLHGQRSTTHLSVPDTVAPQPISESSPTGS